MINIKNLNKTYGFVHALRDVNLHIQDGYVYGVVGSNGAGKTTLFECIAGLINYSGSIEFTGNNIKNQMGFLHTEPYFPSLITGREYLQLIRPLNNQLSLVVMDPEMRSMKLSGKFGHFESNFGCLPPPNTL